MRRLPSSMWTTVIDSTRAWQNPYMSKFRFRMITLWANRFSAEGRTERNSKKHSSSSIGPCPSFPSSHLGFLKAQLAFRQVVNKKTSTRYKQCLPKLISSHSLPRTPKSKKFPCLSTRAKSWWLSTWPASVDLPSNTVRFDNDLLPTTIMVLQMICKKFTTSTRIKALKFSPSLAIK